LGKQRLAHPQISEKWQSPTKSKGEASWFNVGFSQRLVATSGNSLAQAATSSLAF
jgi:hypothetical protein